MNWVHLTFLELLEALKRDFELVRGREGGGVVEDFNPKERNNRHCEWYAGVCVLGKI